MKIRPVLKQLSVIPMTIALGSVLLPGCDRKLGGDVPMTPELQEQWQSEEQNQERALPKQDFLGQPIPGVQVVSPPPTIECLMVELPEIPDEDTPPETPDLLDEESFLTPDTTP